MKKFILFLLFFAFFLFPQNVFAETIHAFDTHITAHKNGLMDFVETINYDFESLDRHGIYRYIPTFAKVGDLYRIYKIENVKVERDGHTENFSKSQNDEQIYLKIGNVDKTITGVHTYKISYTVENGIGSNYVDHDEIYWSTTGNGWQVDIEKATATIDTNFGKDPSQILCFTGAYGSKDANCNIYKNSVTSTILNPYEGLTIVAVYPKDSFPQSILSKEPPQTFGEKLWKVFLASYKYIWFFLNVIVTGYLIYWYQKHKNKKSFGKPAVNFDTPKDEKGKRLAPALCGIMDTAKLERDDVTATIFDLAIRKYIKITQEKTVRKLAPDKTEQIITRLKNPDSALLSFEITLMERLFRDSDTIDVSDLKLDFYQTFQDMEKEAFGLLVEKGYYTKNPKNQKALLIVVAIFALSTLNIILAAVIFFLSTKLNGRTAVGDEVDFKIDGLKVFLQSMDRNYKWQAQKFYTVEQMIPYAMALGYITRFMAALKVLKPNYKPTWYSGTGNFYTGYALFSAAATSNITTAAPSSSGSGGGGFSGGGGGGGGGGSW